jgi:hypothetical protein
MEIYYTIGMLFYIVGCLYWRAVTPLGHWQDKSDIYVHVALTFLSSLVWPGICFIILIGSIVNYVNKKSNPEER